MIRASAPGRAVALLAGALLGAPLPASAEARRPVFKGMTLEEIEPPRDVAAYDYRSPFCLKWHDGCTDCERTTVKGKVTCLARDGDERACVRHSIVCKSVVNASRRQCAVYISGAHIIHSGLAWYRGCERFYDIEPTGLLNTTSDQSFYALRYGVKRGDPRLNDVEGWTCMKARVGYDTHERPPGTPLAMCAKR